MKLIIFIGLLFIITDCHSQIIEIKGRVIDKTTQKPLQGVSIQASQYKGTISNSKGNFRLNLSETNNQIFLTFSYVGYKKMTIACKPNFDNVIELVPSSKDLSEVIISSKAKSLVQRAIEKIPVNYPEKPTIITGISRVYNIVNDSDYYYRSDGVLQVYSPSYSAVDSKQAVKLVQNKFVLRENKKSKYYNDPTKPRWVGEYSSVADFVLSQSAFINLDYLKDYSYFEKEKTVYEGRKVYVIDFESKNKKNIEGTMYIDTATLGFVGFNLTRYNVREIFFVPISLSKISITYQMIDNKWYLKNTHSESKHVINGNSQYTRDFVFTSLDTINIKPFNYSETLQRRNENIKTYKEGGTSDWIVYDSVFKIQELANIIPQIEVPNIDTSAPKKKTNIFLSALGYIRKNENLRLSIGLGKQAIDSKNSNYGSLVDYGLSFGITLRVYKNLFFQQGTTTAYGLGGVITFTNNYLLDYEFKVNKNHRLIAIKPFAGYAYTNIKKDQLNLDQSFKSWVVGVNTSIELTHKKSFFIAPAYHYNYYQGGTYTGIQPTNFSINIGLIFKR